MIVKSIQILDLIFVFNSGNPSYVTGLDFFVGEFAIRTLRPIKTFTKPGFLSSSDEGLRRGSGKGGKQPDEIGQKLH